MTDDKLDSICQDRGRIYGDPWTNHKGIAMMWAPLLYEYAARIARMEPLPPWVVTAMFCLLKVNRMRLGIFHPDNFDDLANYARFTEEFQRREGAPEPEAPRMEDWVETCTGNRFVFDTDEPSGIVIEDIGHALSLVCRFNGHCRQFYSVAEHCLLVADLVREEVPAAELHALLHDAPEAYLSDLAAPIKQFFPDYRQHEARIHRRICRALGVGEVNGDLMAAIKRADRTALAAEARALFAKGDRDWCCEDLAVPGWVRIECLESGEAEIRFLTRYRKLREHFVAAKGAP